MAQTGFTPISTYYTTTAGATPTAGNLVNGELALNINTADGKLFYKDSAGVVQVLATKDSTSGSFTNLSYTGTFTGGTGVVNLGSGQFYKDASGNVGIGVTPNSWASGTTALQVKSVNLYSFTATNNFLNTNAYYDGANWVYQSTNTAVQYQLQDGAHVWKSAISGTSGTAITWLERMKIDSSGNVGIGVTPSAWGGSYKALQMPSGALSSYSNSVMSLYENSYDSGAGTFKYINSSYAAKYDINSGSHNWSIAPSGTAGNAVTFTQAMTLDPSGNLLVGTTSSLARLTVLSSGSTSATRAFSALNSGGFELLSARDDGLIFTGTRGVSPYNNTTASAANVFVNSDGTLARSTSSLKYKTDVQDATHGLAEVLKLRPVTYKGKNDGNKVFGGLIAEEVDAAGLTEFVQYAEDGSPDALAYGQMVSLAFKAIQEQQVMIEELKAKVAALEAK